MIDRTHLFVLEELCLWKGITRGTTSLGHYMVSTRLLGLATYKRGAPNLFLICLKIQGVGHFASGIMNSGMNLEYRDKRRIGGFEYLSRCKDNLFDTRLVYAWDVFGVCRHMVGVWICVIIASLANLN